MQTSEIISMVKQALEAMVIGIPSVFLVLAVFYFVLKIMMYRTTHPRIEEKPEEQDEE